MSVTVETGTWQLDPVRSTVAIRHKTMWGLVTVKGAFTSLSGEGEVGPGGTARGTVTVDAASIETKNAKRDKHLRSADFFDVERHPTITFTIKNAALDADGTARVSGQLTVLGISEPQSVTARVTQAGADAITLTAGLIVDRAEFGLNWNQMGMMRGLTTVTTTLRFARKSK